MGVLGPTGGSELEIKAISFDTSLGQRLACCGPWIPSQMTPLAM